MITIEGYSGCNINVRRDTSTNNGDYILEKSTDDPNYVHRLILQQVKQSEFTVFNKLPFVISPKILYVKRDDVFAVDPITGALGKSKANKCVIGMTFSHHTDALSFLNRAHLADIDEFASHILAVLHQYASASTIQTIPRAVFEDKLLDIRKNVAKNKNIDAKDIEFINGTVIPSLIASLPHAGLNLPIGKCHGDLTMSNILIAPRHASDAQLKLILIDFLDAFVESPLADLAKLAQDLKYAWTLRVSNMTCDPTGLLLALHRMFTKIESAFAHEVWYREYFLLMFVMNQLRVIQYSKDGNVASYLMATVEKEFDLWKQQQVEQQAATFKILP